MALKDNKNKKKDNWSQGLLIKDEEGKIHKLHQGLDKEIIKKEGNFNLNIAPQNDSFAPTPSLDGQADSQADFSFHPEDSYQLDKIAKETPKDSSKKYSLNKIVAKLIVKHNLKFDEINKEYFSNIIFDFFRHRKSILVLREVLNQKILIKKKPLDAKLVNNLVLIIKGIKKKIEIVGGLVVKVEKSLEEVKSEPLVEKKEEIKAKKPLVIKIPEEKKEEVKSEPLVEKKEEIKAKKPLVIKIPEEKKVVLKKESKIKDELPKVFRPTDLSSAKKKIDDVLSKSSEDKTEVLSGPVDELKSLKLSDFRRLGNNSQERVDKILYKINLLEEESFTKKSEGIKAWRDNKIYKLYLEIGNKSLENDEAVKDTIAHYEKEKKEVLTEEEFISISDLNKLLRF